MRRLRVLVDGVLTAGGMTSRTLAAAEAPSRSDSPRPDPPPERKPDFAALEALGAKVIRVPKKAGT